MPHIHSQLSKINTMLVLGLWMITLVSGQTYTPQEVIINSGRPTFFDPSTSIPGKIALEEHVGNSLLSVESIENGTLLLALSQSALGQVPGTIMLRLGRGNTLEV